jgi:hypothetical protein
VFVVVATTSQPLEDKHGIFCIKCFGDIFCVIFSLQKSCECYGPLIGLMKN